LSCPPRATHRIEAKHLAADGVTPIAPSEQTYFDELDRTIVTLTQGFDGTLIRVSSEHDTLGRIVRQTRPYFEGATPQWQQASYDVLNRPVLETFADGSTVATQYHGLTVTETNALNQTNSATSNSQGQVVSITDAAGSSVTYRYDPFGNRSRVTDAYGNVTAYQFDRAGRRIAASDPDMGSWSYGYNVLGQLISQTDAKGQTVTVSYDLLGRARERAAPDLTANWTYDTAPHGVGKLATAATNGGYTRTHSYDALSRPSETRFSIDGQNYAIGITYDAASRVSTISYPSGFTAAYGYTALGYQAQLKNAATGEVYWTANARDAELRLTTQTFGNGVVTQNGFDPKTGRILSIRAGAGAALQDFAYTYDLLGNVTSRSDANHGVTESFTYDNLNRLTTATISADISKSFSYNAIGNLLSKSDVGTYSYPAPGQPRPHAVSAISGSLINTTFSYDANGNQITGNGLTLSYATFNKPTTISRGVALITFAHDPERQRYKQNALSGETLYFAVSGVSAEKFTGAGGTLKWTDYLVAGGERIGMRVAFSSGTVHTRYFHKDHLGSTRVLTNESGGLIEHLAYDAWGKRRFPSGQDDPAGSIASETTIGFTGHEQLAEVGLVHMKGRTYDPLIARFNSPDPFTPDSLSTQSWNRYTYVNNNPVSRIDRNGYQDTGSSDSCCSANPGGFDSFSFSPGDASNGSSSASTSSSSSDSVAGEDTGTLSDPGNDNTEEDAGRTPSVAAPSTPSLVAQSEPVQSNRPTSAPAASRTPAPAQSPQPSRAPTTRSQDDPRDNGPGSSSPTGTPTSTASPGPGGKQSIPGARAGTLRATPDFSGMEDNPAVDTAAFGYLGGATAAPGLPFLEPNPIDAAIGRAVLTLTPAGRAVSLVASIVAILEATEPDVILTDDEEAIDLTNLAMADGGKAGRKQPKNVGELKDRLTRAKRDLSDLESKRNKTPQDKRNADKAQALVKNLEAKIKASEPHGIRGQQGKR
jgi:RHS repeat-associated protein